MKRIVALTLFLAAVPMMAACTETGALLPGVSEELLSKVNVNDVMEIAAATGVEDLDALAAYYNLYAADGDGETSAEAQQEQFAASVQDAAADPGVPAAPVEESYEAPAAAAAPQITAAQEETVSYVSTLTYEGGIPAFEGSSDVEYYCWNGDYYCWDGDAYYCWNGENWEGCWNSNRNGCFSGEYYCWDGNGWYGCWGTDENGNAVGGCWDYDESTDTYEGGCWDYSENSGSYSGGCRGGRRGGRWA